MEGGLGGGKKPEAPEKSPSPARDGASNRWLGRLRGAFRKRARNANHLDRPPKDVRPGLGLGHLRPHSKKRAQLTGEEQRAREREKFAAKKLPPLTREARSRRRLANAD